MPNLILIKYERVIIVSAYMKVQRLGRNKQPWFGAHSDHKQQQKRRERRESKETKPLFNGKDRIQMQKFDKKSIERLELYIEFLKRLVWTTGQHFPKSLGQFFFLIQIFRIVYSAVRREMCICGNAEGQREKNSGACHRLFACTPTAVLRVTTPHLVLLPLLVTSYLHLSKSVCALELLHHRISNP